MLSARIISRFAWDYFRGVARVLAVSLFAVGMVAVILQFPWIVVLLVVPVMVGHSRRWRGSTAHAGRESHVMDESREPAWLDEARRYYSEIGGESTEPVSVFDASGREEVSSESPGTLCLRLEPRFRTSPLVRVLDADGRDEGIIRAEGLVPGVRYAMRRNSELVWTLSVRSIVRRAPRSATGEWRFVDVRHAILLVAELDRHRFWRPRLKGGLVVPTKRVWAMYIEPGRDSFDLLAAIAFLHRQWWHW